MRFLFIIIALLIASEAAFGESSPVVTNVSVRQRADGSNKVDIWYDLDDEEAETLVISVKASSDGGSTWAITPATLSGDVGSGIPKGKSKHIIWDAPADLPGAYGENYKVMVLANLSKYTGEMIYVSDGSFLMGTPDSYSGTHNDNEHPQHSVSLTGFWIGKYEVTRGEYAAFMEDGGYTTQSYWSTDGWSWKNNNSRTQPLYWTAQQSWGSPPGTFTQTDKHPVIGVSYYEAEAFCNWAKGHLPTEAQWEKAASWVESSSAKRIFPWGDTFNVALTNDWNDTIYPKYQTAPVGSYSGGASSYGCMDMSGNAWEWCKDWFASTYYSQTPTGGWADPTGPTSGTYRVMRGNGWGADGSIYGRCNFRSSALPKDSYPSVGFRFAR